MPDADFVAKLARLGETTDHALRRSLALELSDTRDPRVFNVLVRLIQRPTLENYRGSLLYALEKFDCSPVADLLSKIAEDDDGEAGMTAYWILQEQDLI